MNRTFTIHQVYHIDLKMSIHLFTFSDTVCKNLILKIVHYAQMRNQMKRYNIYYRQDGRFEGRILKGKREGKRKYQYFFGKTREEVRNKMEHYHYRTNKNQCCSKPLAILIEDWFFNIRHQIKESTMANYRMKIAKHILPTFGKMPIDSIHSNEIYKFIDCKKKLGLSNRYISDILVLMKSIFKYAAKIYHIFNPMSDISMPKKKAPEIRLLDSEEEDQLCQYLKSHLDHTALGIAISMYTGVRIGELTALQWKDVDFKKRILTVRKTLQRIQCQDETTKTKLIITEPKSESSKRKIPIPVHILPLLIKFQGEENEYLISGKEIPTEPRTLQYRFSKILKNVKLPSVHFHSLRHMFASKCIRLGFDIKTLSEILGHSSVEITLNRYVHSSFEQKVEYMNRLK